MLYNVDITNLISQWQTRANAFGDSTDYALAIHECMFDLNNLLTKSIDEELSYQDFLQMEADSYLSSIEAHESPS